MKLKHTPNHVNCPICSPVDADNRSLAIDPNWSFSDAVDQYLADRKGELKANTHKGYVMNSKRLKEFFQGMKLRDVHVGNLRAYQAERSEVAGATLINAEMSLMQMILKQVGLWEPFLTTYKPLAMSKEKVRKALTQAEEDRLVKTCLRPGKWSVAGHCLIVMMNTTMGFGELRHLRRMDVRLDVQTPYVEVNKDAGGAKNDYRERTIPLNMAALGSMRWLIARWAKLGGTDPSQYLLPHRAQASGGGPDFSRPMGHIYRATRHIFQAAGMPDVDPYDMRSHAITKLLENPKVSSQVAQEIAGHISKKMQDRYSRQRLGAKLSALEAFDAIITVT